MRNVLMVVNVVLALNAIALAFLLVPMGWSMLWLSLALCLAASAHAYAAMRVRS